MNNESIIPYQVFIYLGFKERYTETVHTIEECEQICRDYCNEVGLCVTVTPTKYIYTNGNEPGCFVGLINYPRFPSNPIAIFSKAVELGTKLMLKFNQFRVTVQASDRVLMLCNDDLVNDVE